MGKCVNGVLNPLESFVSNKREYTSPRTRDTGNEKNGNAIIPVLFVYKRRFSREYFYGINASS